MSFSNTLTPLETFYSYLKDVLISSKSLTQRQVQEIFLRALKDYFKRSINLECLAVVATQLYYELYKPHEIDLYFEHDLANALSDATEIDWYFEHRDKNSLNKKIYEGQLKTLKDYYKKNKDVLKGFTKTE